MAEYRISHYQYHRETDEKLNDNMPISNFLKFAKQFEPDEKRQNNYADFFSQERIRIVPVRTCNVCLTYIRNPNLCTQ